MSLVCSFVPSLVDSAAMVTIIAMFSVQYMLRQAWLPWLLGACFVRFALRQSSSFVTVTRCVLCEVCTKVEETVDHQALLRVLP